MVKRVLKYSLDNHKAVSIIYIKGMEFTQRRVQVLKINGDYIKALDIDKGEIRTFKVENILSAMDLKHVPKNYGGLDYTTQEKM